MRPPPTPGPYAIGRSAAALPQPRMEDVRPQIGDLLGHFTPDLLRGAFGGGEIPLILGSRNRQRFPDATRLSRQRLESWILSFTVRVPAEELADVLFDAELDPLQPYVALAVAGLGGPLRSWLTEIERRLELPMGGGFQTLWMSRGGHVSALHHDGFPVHGRWNLTIAGRKRWDFLPPDFAGVRRLPFWHLYRRYSLLYRDPLPAAWSSGSAGGCRFDLVPGQMVTWGRRWWHRVEVAPTGLCASLSTLAHARSERFAAGALLERFCSLVFGEVDTRLGSRCPLVSHRELRRAAASERDRL